MAGFSEAESQLCFSIKFGVNLYGKSLNISIKEDKDPGTNFVIRRQLFSSLLQVIARKNKRLIKETEGAN